MSHDTVVNPALLLSPQWWSRLQRVAAICHASPNEFAREAIEAEIVKRELLLEQEGVLEPQWLALLTALSPNLRLQ
ncbi:MAG: hypothetical protein ACRERD_19150 [Candidatus Binatia bacterium]